MLLPPAVHRGAGAAGAAVERLRPGPRRQQTWPRDLDLASPHREGAIHVQARQIRK